jgi:hypothetical protein
MKSDMRDGMGTTGGTGPAMSTKKGSGMKASTGSQNSKPNSTAVTVKAKRKKGKSPAGPHGRGLIAKLTDRTAKQMAVSHAMESTSMSSHKKARASDGSAGDGKMY